MKATKGTSGSRSNCRNLLSLSTRSTALCDRFEELNRDLVYKHAWINGMAKLRVISNHILSDSKDFLVSISRTHRGAFVMRF